MSFGSNVSNSNRSSPHLLHRACIWTQDLGMGAVLLDTLSNLIRVCLTALPSARHTTTQIQSAQRLRRNANKHFCALKLRLSKI